MRLIDADELMDHVYRDKLDSRELIAEMVKNAPTVTVNEELVKRCQELSANAEYLRSENSKMRGQIVALAFAVRCNGVSGNEVKYEDD